MLCCGVLCRPAKFGRHIADAGFNLVTLEDLAHCWARDLRLLIAVSKTIANLERIGDEAARIARTVQRLLNSGMSSRLRLPVADLS